MKIPHINCHIKMISTINPSEDPSKISTAIANVFPYSVIKTNSLLITATSQELRSFEMIYEAIHNHQSQKAYSRHLQNNINGNTTWFLLNKQAAFVKRVVICDESEESPLGPITVTLTSSNIDEIIDWLVQQN